ncbi:hypothetical protein FBU59_002736 [Linderina macrospora]|uniref:Uncharacterized protein n=1 Tax=Linderina macrospora TaxID=4868 RepID=A0ACC1JAL1_9FUNG|nr:hypothetical protein FBU59_002736 [Linderina macrospora]
MATVRVGIGCFVIKRVNGAVFFLLGKRQGSHGSGYWGLPGGHLDMGEDWSTCAARETFEECGIETDNIVFREATNDVFNPDLHYITLFHSSEIAKEFAHKPVRLMEPDKCQQWVWVSWQEFMENRAPLRDACIEHCFDAASQSEEISLDLLFLPLQNLKKKLQFCAESPVWLG